MIRVTAIKLAVLLAAFPHPTHHRHHKPRPMQKALASVYGEAGDGSAGGPLACGGQLTPGLMEVANKELPCWTRVRVCFRRCVTVPVRDRGPYVAGRSFDLSVAVRDAIGMPDGVFWIRWRVARG